MKFYAVLFIFFSIVYLIFIISTEPTFAFSPPLSYQSISDGSRDWVDMIDFKNVSGNALTDILMVNSFSDGRFFNTTFWLSNSLFQSSRNSTAISNITYGLLIDSDYNNKTGRQGADFNIQIETQLLKDGTLNKTWTQQLEQRSSTLPLLRTTESGVMNVQYKDNGIFKNGNKYVNLSFDLGMIGYPEKYRVVFYSLQKIPKNPWIIDHTNWINIPQPEIEISPINLDLKVGDENKTVDLQIKSTTDLQPIVHFSDIKTEAYQIDFKYHQLEIPSFGTNNNPTNFTISKNAKSQSYNVPISTSTNFPSLSFLPTIKKTFSLPDSIRSENIPKTTSLILNVQPALTINQQVGDFLSIYGIVIGLILGGAMSQVWTLVFDKIKKRNRRKRLTPHRQ